MKRMIILLMPLLAVSCSKEPAHTAAQPAGDVAAPGGAAAGGVAGEGLECMSVYRQNEAARAKDALVKFLAYLDGVDIGAGNRDAVFSEKALALARLGYVNKYLSRTDVDWSAPVAALKKTNYAKKWPKEQTVAYLKSIIAQDATQVAWINEKELLQSIPEDWMLRESRDNSQRDDDEMEEASPPAAENPKLQNPNPQKSPKLQNPKSPKNPKFKTNPNSK